MAAPVHFDVIGLGQCSLDILGRLNRFPEPDQKIELDELLMQGGGPVATALVALSRLDVAVSFFGVVGDDDPGTRIRRELEEEGVDCSGLRVDAGATSQIAFVAVDRLGRRNIFWHQGSTRQLADRDLDMTRIARSRVLHLDGHHHPAALSAARIARENGVVNVLDGGSVRAGTLELLPWIDHLVVSETFAGQMFPGRPVEAQLESLLAYGASAATITLGEKGSWTRSRGEQSFHQPSFPEDVVDTTGCGDVFHAGYIYGLVRDWPLRDSVRFAAACAALKTRRLGGRSAIPNLSEIMKYIGI